jgi:hypothetical protein
VRHEDFLRLVGRSLLEENQSQKRAVVVATSAAYRVAMIGEVGGEVAPPGRYGGHAFGPAGRAADDSVR